MADGIRCMVMRGGTSKGLYLLADDLPDDPAARDELLLRIMGSPDARQIDGLGGAHPLTSKVALVRRSSDGGDGGEADVDYRFLQVAVDEARVSDRQNCGNLLAGVGPFALERGLVGADSTDGDGHVAIRIRMLNTGGLATATVPLRDGRPRYDGDTAISGVPGTAAPVRLDFADVAGSSCGALLPTGHPVDELCGLPVTLIDNGMPVVVLRASDLGVDGHESCADLEANHDLRGRLEQVRLAAGLLMYLGDVTATTVPKLTLVAPPRAGGTLATRTFIPHRCHDAIGVLGAVSVATAALLPDGPAAEVAELDGGGDGGGTVRIEHPTGTFEAAVELGQGALGAGGPVVKRAGIIRTARKLMDGEVFP
ncbi:MAG TPA: 4-oxalomesaconate tautomerase [Acidimicrobiales bacterium]|nr:4-oxalomesaconate tautomerase [Acidimicrobiales bacterium]